MTTQTIPFTLHEFMNSPLTDDPLIQAFTSILIKTFEKLNKLEKKVEELETLSSSDNECIAEINYRMNVAENQIEDLQITRDEEKHQKKCEKFDDIFEDVPDEEEGSGCSVAEALKNLEEK